jgi:hypothetical protein
LVAFSAPGVAAVPSSVVGGAFALDFLALPVVAASAEPAGVAGVAAVAGVAGAAGVAAVPVDGSAGVAGVAGVAGAAGVAGVAGAVSVGWADTAEPNASETPASARCVNFISIPFRIVGRPTERAKARLDERNRVKCSRCRRPVVAAGLAAALSRR